VKIRKRGSDQEKGEKGKKERVPPVFCESGKTAGEKFGGKEKENQIACYTHFFKIAEDGKGEKEEKKERVGTGWVLADNRGMISEDYLWGIEEGRGVVRFIEFWGEEGKREGLGGGVRTMWGEGGKSKIPRSATFQGLIMVRLLGGSY